MTSLSKYFAASLCAVSLSLTAMNAEDNFKYTVDNFADIEVLRYKVPGFEDLSLNQKRLVYSKFYQKVQIFINRRSI